MFNIHRGMVIYLKLRHKIGLNPNHYDPLFDYVARACLLPPQAESYTEKDVQFNGHLWSALTCLSFTFISFSAYILHLSA